MADELDLYDFPSDHVGRKTYVSVRGHSKSIPKYKTYRGGDGRNYLHPEFGGDWSGYSHDTAYVMPDKLAYVSPIDGKEITSRSSHREHCNRHNVYEAGDMKVGDWNNARTPRQLPPMGQSIKQAIEQIRSRG